MSVSLNAQISNRRCQSLEFRASRETSSPMTTPTRPSPTSATSRWKVELNATYKFSDNFRGQGIIRVENNRNQLTEKTRKLRELRTSGTLFFK